MRYLRPALIAALTLSVSLASADSWARHGGRGGPHHHHNAHVRGVLLLGIFPWYYTSPPPYYYGPDYSYAHYAPPTVYVEMFPGTPTPEIPGEFYCPAESAFYPDVKGCAGGWQRVIRAVPGG